MAHRQGCEVYLFEGASEDPIEADVFGSAARAGTPQA
jgi:hypothetical protein